MRRQVVLVSGAPGAGKTTVAVPLAARFGFPLISKDHVKETLWDALDGPSDDLAWSRRVGGAAMEVLWALASRCPQVVLEANFRPHSGHERARLIALEAHVVEVYCRCTPEEAARRFSARALRRHPAHVLQALPNELLAEFDGPMAVGTVIEVNTDRPVDIDGLVRRVRRCLG